MKRTCIICGDDADEPLCKWCFEEAWRQHWESGGRRKDFGPLVGALLILATGCAFWATVLWLLGVI